jgi:hypothetical protein
MCILCNDEDAYKTYMQFLDAMARQGKDADPDKALDAVLDELERTTPRRAVQDSALSTHYPSAPVSPFSCDPADE